MIFNSFDEVEKFTQSIFYPFMFLCFSYPFLVKLLESYMKNRNPIRYRNLEMLWNFVCSGLSIVGFMGVYNCVSILNHLVVRREFVCDSALDAISIFCLTKPLEFVDTLFLVLKKKEISTLHLWHHFSVSLYCYFSVYKIVMFGHYFASMNLIVHSVMYFYYGLMSLRMYWVRKFAIIITGMQILQMFVGTYITLEAYKSEYTVEYEKNNAFYGLIMYVSYLWLFLRFFGDRYNWNISQTGICLIYLVNIGLYMVLSINYFAIVIMTQIGLVVAELML